MTAVVVVVVGSDADVGVSAGPLLMLVTTSQFSVGCEGRQMCGSSAVLATYI